MVFGQALPDKNFPILGKGILRGNLGCPLTY